ncbi:MAG: hypothetical protein IKI81_06145, partial [Selenomonadaceae bacterium]|nr:hypothetical protein [Selenomonadaceae bacterium]
RNAQGRNETTLWTIIRLLLSKFYWLLLAGIAFGLATYLFVTFCITPKYESRVSFYVYNSSDKASNTGTVNNNDLQAAESLAATYSKILGSNSVLDAILEDLGENAGITRKDLSKMVAASVVSDTQLLEVVITSTNARFSCDVANSFVKVAPTEIVRITKAGGVEVVDRPELATEQSSPRRLFDTAIGFVVGVIVSAIILILRMLSDQTIYLPEDIDNLVGLTVLGQIPTIDTPEGNYTFWNLVEGGEIRYGIEEENQSINN